MARRRKTPETGDWLFPNVTDAPLRMKSSRRCSTCWTTCSIAAPLLTGDIVLGVADVDLIYVKLSVLLAALDKVTRRDPVFKAIAARPRKSSKSAPGARAPARQEALTRTRRGFPVSIVHTLVHDRIQTHSR